MTKMLTIPEYEKLVKNANKRMNKYAHVKKGWIEIFNGLIPNYRFYARSGYEKVVARYLSRLCENDETLHFQHENITLKFEGEKRGAIVYVPDFILYRGDEVLNIYEVKGKYEGKDGTKIRRFKKHYPELFPKFVYVTDVKNLPKIAKLGVKSYINIKALEGYLKGML